MITDYTTYDDIRAALGVSTDDLEDTTLALTLYSDYLQGELEDVALTLPATYASIKLLPSPTEVQERFLRTCSLFAVFAVSKQLTAALPLFAAKQVGDGKAVVQRFDNPYLETIKAVNEQYGKTKNRLVSALALVGASSASSSPAVYLGVVSPNIDPVTGT